jgi:hypothetical protein
MSKQSHTTEPQANKKNKPQVEPTPEQATGDLANLTALPSGILSGGDGSTQNQAALLNDRRWQSVQRQSMAARIGQIQGNRHLQRVISSQPKAQDRPAQGRQTKTPNKVGEMESPATTASATTVVVQRETEDGKATSTQIASLTLMQPNVTKAASNATARHKAVTNLVQDGIKAGDKIEQHMNHISTVYRGAYKNYTDALSAAEQEAENEKMLRDAAIGVVLAVAGGLTLGAALEAYAAGKIAVKIAVDAGSELAEILGAKGVELGTDVGDEAEAKQLKPADGSEPGPKELQHWQTLAKFFREVALLSGLTEPLNEQTANATKVDGDIQAYITGGEGKLSVDKLIEAIDKVNAMDATGKDVEKQIEAAKKSISEAEAGYAAAAAKADQTKMEQDLWLTWMASLPPRSRVLDYSSIEDRLHAIGVLGHNSILGIDFGSYTFDAEEELALAAARDRVRYTADGPVVVGSEGGGGASQESAYREQAERNRQSWMLPAPGEGQGGAPPDWKPPEKKEEPQGGQGGAPAGY